MPAPTNISALTATELVLDDMAVMQTVDDAGTTYTVWYKITNPDVGEIGVWPFGDLVTYKPTTKVYEADGTTQVTISVLENRRLQFPSDGTTRYLKIIPNGGNPSPAVLTLSGLYFTELDPFPVVGSILQDDDNEGMPSIVMNSAGSIRKFIQGFANGESASILPNGKSIWTRDDESGANNGKANIYSANGLSLIATVTINADTGNLQALPSGASNTYFYILDTNLTLKLYQIDDAGNIISSVWSIGSGFDIVGIAPSRDDTILYYASLTTPTVIKRWDLVNNVALSNLYTLPAGFLSNQNCLLVLSDGTIVAGADHPSATESHKVFHISAAGALLDTYDITVASFKIDKMALNKDDSTASFWVWMQNISIGVNTYQEINTTGGTVISTFSIEQYIEGAYFTETATPANKFGPDGSCAFIIIRKALQTGIYKMVPGKTNDTIWQADGSTSVVKIP